jgi:hypothetical protein
MTRLKYLDPADGLYKLLPVGGGSGGPDEVAVQDTEPTADEDLWVNLSDTGSGGITRTEADTLFVHKTGDEAVAGVKTFGSSPLLPGNATTNLQAVPKQQLDAITAVPTGFRNVIRNGDMQIAQRGNGPFTAVNAYAMDGFRTSITGGSYTLSRVIPLGTSPEAAVAVSGQANATSDYFIFLQVIEDVATLHGKTATISFTARAASGTPKVALELYQSFGSGGSPSTAVPTSVGVVTLSTVNTRYSLTVAVPSIAGKTLGTAGDSLLRLNFWLSAGSTYGSRTGNIGIQNNTFYITDVQLEEGPVATPFERLPIQQQLAWCQRYFWRNQADQQYSMFGSGQATTTGTARILIQLPVQQRAMPTFGSSPASWFRLVDGIAQIATSLAISSGGNGIRTVALDITAPNLTQYRPYWLDANNTGNAYLDFSAEL